MSCSCSPVLRLRAILVSLWVCTLSACGATPDAAPNATPNATPNAAEGIVGVWEMRYHDAVNQPYVNVLELNADGTYATYFQDRTPNDRGQYRYDSGTLTFTSDVEARFSGDFPARLEDANLTLTLPPTPLTPQTHVVQWQRSELTPAFESTIAMGRAVPVQLTRFVGAAIVGLGQAWQPDALPISLDVRHNYKGEAEAQLVLYSQATKREMLITATRYHVATRDYFAQPGRHLPLPDRFVELTDILVSAQQAGLQGVFTRASLRTYDPAGPAWMISSTGPKGATYSAIDGVRIEGDVTGYIAAYEFQANEAAQAWRRLLARAPTKKESQRAKCREIVEKTECEAWSCNWTGGENFDTGFNLCVPNLFMLLD